MRRMRQTMIALAAAALLAGPVAAQGGQGPRGRPATPAGAGVMDRNPVAVLLERRDELELTADQVARLEAVQARVERENAPRIERLRAALGDRPARDLTDEERVQLRERMRELQPVRTEIRETNRAAMEEVRGILTAEQRTKIRSASRGRGPAASRGARGASVARILQHREALGLSEDQIARLEAIRDSQRAAHEQVRAILTDEQESRLREMARRPRPDDAARRRPGRGQGAGGGEGVRPTPPPALS
ncbi:MAG: Spy/CpxP family protein refolding chaperone [Gemmatimonadetes bacterium]|nr:Spy/CpxP family protein refolding chaperone [Gemmatimonadota bacterium]